MSKTKIEIPFWGKAAIGVGAGIVGIAIFYIIKRNISNIKALADSKKEVSATQDTLSALTKAGVKPTLDSLKIQQAANSIFSAINGYGTDVQGVYRAFANINTDVDLVNLIKAFGVREISTGAGNPAPNLKGTLSQVLTDELSSAEINALNNMLARKGIKYRF